jgi:hypothetical protein
VIRSVLALVVVLAMAAAVGVVFAKFASPRGLRRDGHCSPVEFWALSNICAPTRPQPPTKFIMSAAPKVMMATGIDGESENSFSAVW